MDKEDETHTKKGTLEILKREREREEKKEKKKQNSTEAIRDAEPALNEDARNCQNKQNASGILNLLSGKTYQERPSEKGWQKEHLTTKRNRLIRRQTTQ